MVSIAGPQWISWKSEFSNQDKRQMKFDDDWELPNGRREIPDELWEILTTNLCHCTSFDAFKAILASGWICPNKKGEYDTSTDHSKDSFANRNNLVALFDFDPIGKNNVVGPTIDWWRFFFDIFKPVTIIILIDRDALKSTFIPNKPMWEAQLKARSKLGLIIPRVEAWSSEAIPINEINGYVAVWDSKTFFTFSDKDMSFFMRSMTTAPIRIFRRASYFRFCFLVFVSSF